MAIIMDGNGRWARARGRPRVAGHREGAKVARRIVEAAPDLGIGVLTLYAFSSDNWERPPLEVRSLMRLFRGYLRGETPTCVRRGVRLSVIGRRDRLDAPLLEAIEAAERVTAGGRMLHLRIALDYSARDAIVAAALQCARDGMSWSEGEGLDEARAAFTARLGAAMHLDGASPGVDLLIRTGGEQRLSDFLLWESAYAELVFLERRWPEFTVRDLEAAVREFGRRERRYGRVLEAAG